MKTILILDDDQVVRESLADFFEDRLWRSIQAESAEDALKLLKDESPSGALVDIRLPGMDGTDFIRTIYRKKPDMVFVLFTGTPGYKIPPDLLEVPRVSKCLFKKPVTSICDLEKELLMMIECMVKHGK